MFSNWLAQGRFSSIFASGLLALGLFAFVSGCSQEDEPSDRPPVVKIKDAQCLDRTDELLAQYLDGQLSQGDVNAFWRCLVHSFQMFKTHTKGQEIGLYSTNELRTFLQTFFLGDIQISDALMAELMEVKKLLLGGSVDYVTTVEIDHTILLFEDFRQLTVDLLPHVQLINGEFYRYQKSYTTEELNQSLVTLNGIVERLARLIQSSGQSYRFENFQRLLEESSHLIRGKGKNSRIYFVRDLIPILSGLKNSLVGSPQDRILPGQWQDFTAILSEVFGLWMRYEHFSFHQGWSSDVTKLEAAFKYMYAGTQRLGQVISHTDKDLDWQKLEKLIDALDRVVMDHQGSSPIAEFKKYLPLVGELKAQLVGGSKNWVAISEWPTLMFRLTQIAEVGMRWVHLVSPFNWSEGLGLEQLNIAIQTAFKVLQESLQNKKNFQISLNDLRDLVTQAGAVNLLPLGLTANSVNQTLPVFLQKIFRGSPHEIADEKEEGLGFEHLKYLSQQWILWFKSQKWANEFVNSGTVSVSLRTSSTSMDPTLREIQDILVTSPWPMVSDLHKRLIFQPSTEISWDQAGVTQVNWSRALLRLLVRAYATEDERRQKVIGLSQDELAKLSNDLFPLAVDIGLFAPTDTEVWKRIFLESDLFMPRSNGDTMINLVEGIEYLSFVLSGINAGNELNHSLSSECWPEGTSGGQVNTPCFRESLTQHREELLSHLPRFLDFSRSLSPDQWSQLIEYLEMAVRGSDGSSISLPIKTSDIKEFFVLLQYLETFFLRFNEDLNMNKINLSETLRAFPVYDHPLQNLLGIDGSEATKGLFTYMIKSCHPPFDTGDMEEFEQWLNHPETWSIDSDRVCLAQVLANLAQSMQVSSGSRTISGAIVNRSLGFHQFRSYPW